MSGMDYHQGQAVSKLVQLCSKKIDATGLVTELNSGLFAVKRKDFNFFAFPRFHIGTAHQQEPILVDR